MDPGSISTTHHSLNLSNYYPHVSVLRNSDVSASRSELSRGSMMDFVSAGSEKGVATYFITGPKPMIVSDVTRRCKS